MNKICNMALKARHFKSNVIMNAVHSVTLGQNLWYRANDLAKALGYSNRNKAVREHVPDASIKTLQSLISMQVVLICDQPLNANDLASKYIDKKGAELLASKSRMPNALQVANDLGLDLKRVNITWKEQEILSLILETFDGELMSVHFRIGSYVVDLYFPVHKVAIECDERGHVDRNRQKELQREHFITQQLNCTWVRFNPDAKDFKATTVLNLIYHKLNSNRHVAQLC